MRWFKNINNPSSIKFSVCVPYYNMSKFIEECLSSVVRQTHTNWEIIVLNDGSNAENSSKLENVVANLNTHLIESQTISIINSENGGLFAARCKMYEKANGDAIINLDADDMLFCENALEEIASAFCKYSCEMVIFNATRTSSGIIDKNLNAIVSGNTTTDIKIIQNEFCCNDQLNNVWIKAIPTKLVNKALEKCPDKSRRINMTEDIYFSLFFLDVINSVFVIDRPLYFYRVNDSSTVYKFDEARLDDQIFVQQQLEKYATKWGVANFDKYKHTNEFFIYGDIMYINLSNSTKDEKISAYKELRNNDFVSERLNNCRLKQLPLHKKIPLKLFRNKRFSQLNFYFTLLQEVKNLRKK